MIIDASCFYGFWPEYPVKGLITDVTRELKEWGITSALITPLAAVWCRNQHLYNRALLHETEPYPELLPVPVLDPALPAWREEVANMLRDKRVKAFRVFLNYTRFDLTRRDNLDDFFDFFQQNKLLLIMQRRMLDPRYQHQRAVVPDADVNYLLKTASDFCGLKLIIGGVSAVTDPALVLRHPGIYLDTSQMDGLHALRHCIDQGLLTRLLFGSHTPLFETSSAFRRILGDIDDKEASSIFSENIRSLMLGV